jgi:hypothetical protein
MIIGRLTQVVLRFNESLSQLGQSRQFGRVPVTSGLLRTTDMVGPARLVRYVPFPEVTQPNLFLIATHYFLNRASSPVGLVSQLASPFQSPPGILWAEASAASHRRQQVQSP